MAEQLVIRFNRKTKKVEQWVRATTTTKAQWVALDAVDQPASFEVSEDGLSAIITLASGVQWRISTDAVPDNQLKTERIGGTPETPEWEIMTPEEMTAEGLPAGTWQRNIRTGAIQRRAAAPPPEKPDWATFDPPEGYRWNLKLDGTWDIVAEEPQGPQTLDQAIYQALIAGDQAKLDALLEFQDRVSPYQQAQLAQRQAEFGATFQQRQAEERRRQLEWDMQYGATQQAKDRASQQWQAEFGQGQYQFERTQAQRELEAQRQHQLAALRMGLDIQRSPGDWWTYFNMLGSREPSVPYTPGEKVPRTWADQWAQFGGRATPPGGVPTFGGQPQALAAPTGVPQLAAPSTEPAPTPYAPPGFGAPEQVAAWLKAQGITPETGPPGFRTTPTPAGMPDLETIKRRQAQGYILMHKAGEYAWVAGGPEGGYDDYIAAGWAATPYTETAAVPPALATAAAPTQYPGNYPGQNLSPEQLAGQMTAQDTEFMQRGYWKFRLPSGEINYVAPEDVNRAMQLGWTEIPWPGQQRGGEGAFALSMPSPSSQLALPAPTGAAAQSFRFPGLAPQGWKAPRLEAAFRGQQVGQPRQLPSLGAPVFPSGQSWAELLTSGQQAFRGEVESQGFPWGDYMTQWQRTLPTWNKTVPFLRRPARLGWR